MNETSEKMHLSILARQANPHGDSNIQTGKGGWRTLPGYSGTERLGIIFREMTARLLGNNSKFEPKELLRETDIMGRGNINTL